MELSEELEFCVHRCKKLADEMKICTCGEFIGLEPPGRSAYIKAVRNERLERFYSDLFCIPLYRSLHDYLLVKTEVVELINGMNAVEFRNDCQKALERRYCLPPFDNLGNHPNFAKFRTFFMYSEADGSKAFFNSENSVIAPEKWQPEFNLFDNMCILLKTNDFRLIATLEDNKQSISKLFIFSPARSRSREFVGSECGTMLHTPWLSNSRAESTLCSTPSLALSGLSFARADEEIVAIRKLICGIVGSNIAVADCVNVLKRCPPELLRGYYPQDSQLTVELDIYSTLLFGRTKSPSFLKQYLTQKRLEAGLSRNQPLCDWAVENMPARCASATRRATSTSCVRSLSNPRNYRSQEESQDMKLYIRRAIQHAKEVLPELDSSKVLNLDCFELEITKELPYGISPSTIIKTAAILEISDFAFGAVFTFSAFFEVSRNCLTTKYGKCTPLIFFNMCSYLYELRCFEAVDNDGIALVLGGKPTIQFITRLAKLATKLRAQNADALNALLCCIETSEPVKTSEYNLICELFVELLFKQPNAKNVDDALRLIIKEKMAKVSVSQVEISEERAALESSIKNRGHEEEFALQIAGKLLGNQLLNAEIDTLSSKFGLVNCMELERLCDYLIAVDFHQILLLSAPVRAVTLLYGKLSNSPNASSVLLARISKQDDVVYSGLKTSAFTLLFDMENDVAFNDCVDELIRLELAGLIWRQKSVIEVFE